MPREIGADFAIDFEKEDPVKRILEITDGIGADEVLECSGADVAPMQCVNSVRKGGKINLIGFFEDEKVELPSMTKMVLDEILMVGSRANPNVSEEVLNLFAVGIIDGQKVVSHHFPLERYPEALDTFVNRKDGAIKVVIEP